MPSKKPPVAIFTCTEDDIFGHSGAPLPRDPKAVRHALPDEQPHILALTDHMRALKALGWREPMYAPCDNTPFLSIEGGSTGVHETTRDKEGRFWVYDGDVWPADPWMWKPIP